MHCPSFVDHYSIGRVLLTGGGWQEMKSGLKSAALRAKTIPFIPEILVSGEYLGVEELRKPRDDGTLFFHPFKKRVAVGNVQVEAMVKVAERKEYQLAYYLKADHVMDSAQTQNPPDGGFGRDVLFRGSGVSSEPTTMPESTSTPLLTVDLNLAHTLDAVNSDDDWNIQILHVWDKDGNELDPETLEPSAENAQPDIEYRKKSDGFTVFFPNTKRGEDAWREIARANQAAWAGFAASAGIDPLRFADGNVQNSLVNKLLKQMEASGIRVEKAKPQTLSSEDSDALLADLMASDEPAEEHTTEAVQAEQAQPAAKQEHPIIQSMRALLNAPDDALLAQAKAALADDAALFDDAPDALRHATHVTKTSIQSELAQ